MLVNPLGSDRGIGRHSDPHRAGFHAADYDPGDVTSGLWPTLSRGINSKYTSRHPALDINCAAYGCGVYSTTGGVVVGLNVGSFRGPDSYVQIRGEDGYHDLYAHVLPAEGLQVRNRVEPGQLIGSTDMTGVTNTGPHVHYELRGRGGAGNLNPCLRLGC